MAKSIRSAVRLEAANAKCFRACDSSAAHSVTWFMHMFAHVAFLKLPEASIWLSFGFNRHKKLPTLLAVHRPMKLKITLGNV